LGGEGEYRDAPVEKLLGQRVIEEVPLFLTGSIEPQDHGEGTLALGAGKQERDLLPPLDHGAALGIKLKPAAADIGGLSAHKNRSLEPAFDRAFGVEGMGVLGD